MMRAFERHSRSDHSIIVVEHDGVFYAIYGDGMERLIETLQTNWRASVESIALGQSIVWKPV